MEKFIINWIPGIGIGILIQIIIPERFWLILIITTIIFVTRELKIESLIKEKIQDDKFHQQIQGILANHSSDVTKRPYSDKEKDIPSDMASYMGAFKNKTKDE